MEKITMTRQELYDLIWKEPFIVLAKKYNISDNGLRKICKRMNIPNPKMGFWQKVNYGKRVIIEPLPSNYSGKNEIMLDEKSLDDDNLSPNAILHKLTKEIESHEELPLQVPERLTNPDKMIAKAKEDLTQVKRPYKSLDGLIGTNAGVLNITVTQVNVPRALRLMDALIKLLRARGHEIEIHDGTTLIIFDERIHF